jgi:hypothetical protein
VVCKICFLDATRNFTTLFPAIWKYEMDTHVRSAHPGYSSPSRPVGKLITRGVGGALDLGLEEESWLGVPKTIPWIEPTPSKSQWTTVLIQLLLYLLYTVYSSLDSLQRGHETGDLMHSTSGLEPAFGAASCGASPSGAFRDSRPAHLLV